MELSVQDLCFTWLCFGVKGCRSIIVEPKTVRSEVTDCCEHGEWYCSLRESYNTLACFPMRLDDFGILGQLFTFEWVDIAFQDIA